MRIVRERRVAGGFSLLEALFAIVILTIGLLAISALFAQAIYATQFSQLDQIAKQKAREALESIYSARNDSQLSFDSIQNAPNGIFKAGFQPLLVPGTDGIVGSTSQSATLDYVRLPGPDGIIRNTTADTIIPLSNYQRQISIEQTVNPDGSINATLRKITVTVRINEPGHGQRDYGVVGYISTYK